MCVVPAVSQEDLMLLRLYSPRMAVRTVLLLGIQPYTVVPTAIASVVGWVLRLALGEPFTDTQEASGQVGPILSVVHNRVQMQRLIVLVLARWVQKEAQENLIFGFAV